MLNLLTVIYKMIGNNIDKYLFRLKIDIYLNYLHRKSNEYKKKEIVNKFIYH